MDQLSTQEAMAKARALAKTAAYGGMDYEQAKIQAQELLDIVNIRGREIAKKYNKRYRPITFLGLGR